jgi:hypothetical protein
MTKSSKQPTRRRPTPPNHPAQVQRPRLRQLARRPPEGQRRKVPQVWPHDGLHGPGPRQGQRPLWGLREAAGGVRRPRAGGGVDKVPLAPAGRVGAVAGDVRAVHGAAVMGVRVCILVRVYVVCVCVRRCSWVQSWVVPFAAKEGRWLRSRVPSRSRHLAPPSPLTAAPPAKPRRLIISASRPVRAPQRLRRRVQHQARQGKRDAPPGARVCGHGRRQVRAGPHHGTKASALLPTSSDLTSCSNQPPAHFIIKKLTTGTKTPQVRRVRGRPRRRADRPPPGLQPLRPQRRNRRQRQHRQPPRAAGQPDAGAQGVPHGGHAEGRADVAGRGERGGGGVGLVQFCAGGRKQGKKIPSYSISSCAGRPFPPSTKPPAAAVTRRWASTRRRGSGRPAPTRTQTAARCSLRCVVMSYACPSL